MSNIMAHLEIMSNVIQYFGPSKYDCSTLVTWQDYWGNLKISAYLPKLPNFAGKFPMVRAFYRFLPISRLKNEISLKKNIKEEKNHLEKESLEDISLTEHLYSLVLKIN